MRTKNEIILKWVISPVAYFVIILILAKNFFKKTFGQIRAGFQFALPRMKLGNLKTRHNAPNVQLFHLDGSTFKLSEKMGSRPLILIFGSYT